MQPRAAHVILAFVAAALIAAAVYTVEFAAESGMTPDSLTFMFTLTLIVELPFVLLGSVPLWLVLRWRRVQSPWAFALGGAALALTAYLVFVAMGMSEASDRPMSFSENLARPFPIARISAALAGGGVGGAVFWRIWVKKAFLPDSV